jgi:hypothetical protein
MAVDQAGQDVVIAKIDDPRALYRCKAPFDPDDPPIVDNDAARAPRRSSRPIEQPTGVNDRECRRLSSKGGRSNEDCRCGSKEMDRAQKLFLKIGSSSSLSAAFRARKERQGRRTAPSAAYAALLDLFSTNGA